MKLKRLQYGTVGRPSHGGYGCYGRCSYDRSQDRHDAVPVSVRFVAFEPVKALVRDGTPRVWLIEGYGPTLSEAMKDLARNIVKFKKS